ncbi:MAG: helix-turn-helix domain-containing protein [Gaiellaceae bacterium]|nr:helix-turn-helix domain-containing protein [Gaiellaceae bacterium]
MSSALRQARRRAGLSQAELADRAGVSRSLVSAIEGGRHVPNVRAALALAQALGETVEALFPPEGEASGLVGIDGRPLRAGALGRVGRVGDLAVAAPLAARSALLWPVPEVAGGEDGPRLLPGAQAEGLVVAGCEPALGIAEGLLAARGATRLVAVPCSTAAALEALRAGRCHGAVVHGREADLAELEVPAVDRWHLARWRVGLAYRAERPAALEELVAGALVVREPGAVSQRALERAVAGAGTTLEQRGPVAGGHLDAARIALYSGLPAVTYEPAAVRFGLRFLPLETHVVELWIASVWREHPGARALVDLLGTPAFRRRVEAIGAYELTGCGARLGPRRAESTR